MKRKTLAPKLYFKLVRGLEHARARNVKEWASAVVRSTTTRQRQTLLLALEDGFGRIKLTA